MPDTSPPQYDACSQPESSVTAFERCLELNPHRQDVRSRYRILKIQSETTHSFPEAHQIHFMVDCELSASLDEEIEDMGSGIVLESIHDRTSTILSESGDDGWTDSETEEYSEG